MASAVVSSSSSPRVVPKLNPANIVTGSRFFTLPPFLWAVDHGHMQIAAVALIICGLFDKLDGRFAKWFNCASPFGELFDAIADGICYGFLLIVVAAYGLAPAVPAILVIVLGLINTGLRVAFARRAGRKTNYKSYAMERVVAYTAFLVAFAIGQYEAVYFYWVFVAIMAFVVLHDAKRMVIDPPPRALA
jgi:phosphatidylglycerophosphate synthase